MGAGTKRIELLAPAGSFDSMKAAFAAGADAVYIGGSRFGARAYAENPDADGLLSAIDYAHLRGKKLYLTVNTLLKEEELAEELYGYLLPFYRQGLDAVIVQDLGVLRFVRNCFPDLPVHASTQMTVTGYLSAKALEAYGVKRVVTARELSLEEIREIRAACALEIESFVHGALCYCYSGQCLFSSLAGGRSGNRGRCAQPCRLPYQVYGAGPEGKKGKRMNRDDQAYVLSPKDMNTLSILPAILEAGVTSLKIEGRMKKPEYTAGVTAVYRKYLDLCLAGKPCKVEKEDEKRLFDLFNRNGFNGGYYAQHNGKNMIALKEPAFRAENEAWRREIRVQYLDREFKRKIKGNVTVMKHFPARMQMKVDGLAISVDGETVCEAQKQPLTRQQLLKQVSRLGDTAFDWDELDVRLDADCFLPVGKMNELRRNAVEALETTILRQYRREGDGFLLAAGSVSAGEQPHPAQEPPAGASRELSVQVSSAEQFQEALRWKEVSRIYVDALLAGPEEWNALADRVHGANKSCFLVMPPIFRKESRIFFERWDGQLRAAGFDGFLIGSQEAKAYLDSRQIPGERMADHMLYSYNRQAVEFLREQGYSGDTAPVELNARELARRGVRDSELIGYGYLPMMVSTNCLYQTLTGCRKQEMESRGFPDAFLEDRLHNLFPVRMNCRFCYNTIYNTAPLMLLDELEKQNALRPKWLRLLFTVESSEQTGRVIRLAVNGCSRAELEQMGAYTRGHFRRGVE